MGDVIKLFKTEMSDDELMALSKKYGRHYYLKFRHEYGYDWVEQEEIESELILKALEAREKFKERKATTANVKTYVITAFKNRMENYRKRTLYQQSKTHALAADLAGRRRKRAAGVASRMGSE